MINNKARDIVDSFAGGGLIALKFAVPILFILGLGAPLVEVFTKGPIFHALVITFIALMMSCLVVTFALIALYWLEKK